MQTCTVYFAVYITLQFISFGRNKVITAHAKFSMNSLLHFLQIHTLVFVNVHLNNQKTSFLPLNFFSSNNIL